MDGNNIINIGKLVRVNGLGPGAYDKCSQCIDFDFDPPILVTECSVELYLSNVSILGSTAAVVFFRFSY